MNVPDCNKVSERTIPSLGKVVAGLSRKLDAERIGSGALAELKRISGQHLPPAFWRLYLTFIPEEWRTSGGRPSYSLDKAWAGLVRAMVEMAPNPHSFQPSLGTALGQTGYSEARFVRLLRAERETLARELRVAASWLSRTGTRSISWERPASLLIPRNRLMPIRPRIVRHELARDYFGVSHQQAQSKGTIKETPQA